MTPEYALKITGFSEIGASKLIHDVETHIKKCVTDLIVNNNSAVKRLMCKLDDFLQSEQYIAQTNLRKWLSTIPDIGEHLSHPYFTHRLLSHKMREMLSLLEDIREPNSAKLKERNEEFIVREIDNYDVTTQHVFHHFLIDGWIAL